MRNTLKLGSMLIATLVALAGCTPPGERVEAAAQALDVTVSLMQADGGEDDGTILWELVDGEDDGTFLWKILEAADGGEDDGTILWEILEAADGGEDDGTILWEIVNATGSTVCTVAGSYLLDSAGQHLFEVRNGDVYKLRATSPAYVFDRDLVLDASGAPLISANPSQENESDGRKLIIAALLAGKCGSAGVP